MRLDEINENPVDKYEEFLDRLYNYFYISNNDFTNTVMKYSNNLTIAFGYPLPSQMPVVDMIAYANTNGYPIISPGSGLMFFLEKPPSIKKYLKGGAESIMPIVRYFTNIKEPWRISNL